MRHVIECEGIDYLDYGMSPLERYLTHEEVWELKRIVREIAKENE